MKATVAGRVRVVEPSTFVVGLYLGDGCIGLLRDPGRLGRVSLCPGRDCGWLFLNASGRRRWCSMSTCGSREKMRRLYRRQHEQVD